MTVRWDAGAPATGWSWVKASMEAAPVPRRLVQYAVDFDRFRRPPGSDLLGSEAGTPR